MIGINKMNDDQKMQIIEDLFQDTLTRLKALHEEKLGLIKKFRAENNLVELNKIRESIKG
jgi:hypothetical protein